MTSSSAFSTVKATAGAAAARTRTFLARAGLTKWRLVGLAVALFSVSTLGWALLSPAPASSSRVEGTASVSLSPAPLVGHVAPDVTFLDLSNNQVRLASLHGKVVVLNFWYVACEPCRFEMPILERTSHADAARGLVIVGVNIVDDAQTASAFVAQLGIDYLIVRDRGQRAVLAYQVTKTPTSFVIDRDGVVRAVVLGAITDTATLNGYIAPLLATR